MRLDEADLALAELETTRIPASVLVAEIRRLRRENEELLERMRRANESIHDLIAAAEEAEGFL